MREQTSGESEVLQELRRECYDTMQDSSMLSGFFQGRVLSMLSHMVRPNVVLEIGTYLGYSALCFAEGLAEDGKVITIDVQEETNRVARAFVEKPMYRDKYRVSCWAAADTHPYVAGNLRPRVHRRG